MEFQQSGLKVVMESIVKRDRKRSYELTLLKMERIGWGSPD
jgi:hypothetical protein